MREKAGMKGMDHFDPKLSMRQISKNKWANQKTVREMFFKDDKKKSEKWKLINQAK